MKHFEVEFVLPIFHAASWQEAEEKFRVYMKTIDIDEHLCCIDLLEDQPECPGVDSGCDGVWFANGKEMYF